MTPKENFQFLNSYLSEMGPAIREHDGFIDKYIGDAIMALFETPDEAVCSAIEMYQRLHHYNERRRSQGDFSVHMGVGIHEGSLMLGTIGEEQRMETTVISDAVNLASPFGRNDKNLWCKYFN